MSGSNDSVRISINADAADFSETMVSAMTDAQKFNAILKSVNNDLAKAAAIWDQGSEAITKYASALSGSSNAAKAAQTSFASLMTAATSTEGGFKSAADSATVFIKALNPTPLQALRSLMGAEMPAAFRMTQNATLGVVEEMTGLNRNFASAALSAAAFTRALNPAPAAAFRAALNEIAAGNRVVSTTIGSVIAEQTGLGRAFTSAAESARSFMAALNPTPLAAFRAAMSEQIPAGLRTTQVTMEQAIAASTGLGATFKSAAESAEIFKRALDPSPLMQMRDLMGDAVPAAVTHTTTTINELIDGMTREGQATKSAADSAQVFARGLREVIGPLAQMRDLMGESLTGSLRQTETTINELVGALTREGQASKSAAESAQVFAAALGQVQTPAQRLRSMMATEVPGAFKLTQQATREAINDLTGVSREFKSAEESARAFNQALDPSPLQRTKQLLDETTHGAHGASGGFSMITHEVIVLGHEAMMGNFSRIPGSLLVLTEYCGNFRSKVIELAASMTSMGWAGVAAIGAVAGAFVALIIRAHEATVAVREAMNAATMGGRDPKEAAAAVKSGAEGMKEIGVMGHHAAYEVSAAIESLGEVGEAEKTRLQALGTQFFLNWGSDAKKTAQEISQIFASDSSLKSYLDQQHLLSSKAADAWADTTSSAKHYEIGIKAIEDRLSSIGPKIKQMVDDASFNRAQYMVGDGSPLMPVAGAGNVTGPQSLGDFDPGSKRRSAASEEEDAAVLKLTAHNRELKTLTDERDSATRALARAEADHDAAGAAAARQAIENGNVLIAQWKAQGDASWAQKQQAALDQILVKVGATAISVRARDEALNRERVKFWEDAAKNIAKTPEQIQMAEEKANQARLALQGEVVAGNAAAARAATAAARKSLEERLAELSAEQAANRDDYAKVAALEKQKLDLIRGSVGEKSKLYQDELKRQEMMERANTLEIAKVKEQELQQKRSQDQAAFQIKKDLDDEAVIEKKMTHEQELADLRALAASQHAIELQMANDVLAGLDKQSKAYEEYYNKIQTMQAQWAAQDAKLVRDVRMKEEQEFNKLAAPFESAISGQVSAMLRGTETIGQGVQKMAANIVTEYATMAVKTMMHSAAMAAWDVAKQLWSQTTQTSAVVSGQTAQTAAVVTGEAARQTAKTAAHVAGSAMEAASGTASVMNAAYKAAANTYASVSAIPYVGWIMAPVAAAGAFAAVAAYNVMTSLDVGAWNLPHDMPANLHAGEMVIPQNFAEGLRSGGGIGGGPMTQNINYSPTIHGGGGGDMHALMQGQAAAFKSYIWHATRNGSLALPKGR